MMGMKIETYDSEGNIVSSSDTRSLEDVKELKKREVNTYRDIVLNGGVMFNGSKFDTDDRGKQNLTGIVSAIASGITLPEGFTWRDANNIDHPMDEGDLLSFSAAMIEFTNTGYAVSWFHKNSIDALQTNDEVDNYDFTTGWPE